MNGLPEPEEGECIAQIMAPRGGNVIEIVFEESPGVQCEGLAVLPAKFRKLVWVKRGDFVIVAGASGDIEISDGGSGAVQFRVQHVLYKEQVRHIKARGLWPKLFEDAGSPEDAGTAVDAAAAEEPSRPAPPDLPGAPASDLQALRDALPVTLPPVAPSGRARIVIENLGGGDSDESESDDNSGFLVNTNRRKNVPSPSSSEEGEENEDGE